MILFYLVQETYVILHCLAEERPKMIWSSLGVTSTSPLTGTFLDPFSHLFSFSEEEAHFRHHAGILHNPPTNEAQARPPTIMSSRGASRAGSAASSAGGANLSAKMDGIRQELRRRQLDSPMLRRLTSQQSAERPREVFNYQTERTTNRPVFTSVPTAYRATRCPEPDLRYCWSPAQTRSEASRPSTASSMAIPSPVAAGGSTTAREDRPAAPTPPAAPAMERRPSSAARRQRRPQTAPALMAQTAKEAPPQRLVPSATEIAPPVKPETPAKAKEEAKEKAEEKAEAEVTEAAVEDGAAAAETPVPVESREEPLTVDDLLDDPYDKALKIHGWKMEIPGDPLGLKWVEKICRFLFHKDAIFFHS